MSNKKSLKLEKVYKRFGSRKVFYVHAICTAITLATVVVNIILTFTTNIYTPEKLLEHLALCVLAMVLLNIPVFMRTKLNYNIPAFIHIVVAIFIIAHCVLGEIYRVYDHSVVFDKLLHTTAGIVIAILGFSIVYGFSKNDSRTVRLSPVFVAIFSFCFAITLLVLWEVFEFAMDSLLGVNMQRYKDSLYEVIDSEGVKHIATTTAQGNGIKDTMIDMILGALGAIVVCIGGGILLKKYPNSTKLYITRKRVVISGSFTKHDSSEIRADDANQELPPVITATAEIHITKTTALAEGEAVGEVAATADTAK